MKIEDVFRAQLKKFRKDAGITQGALAEKINVTVGSVNAWEQGKTFPTPQNINALAAVFGCIPSALFMHPPVGKPSLREALLLMIDTCGFYIEGKLKKKKD